MKIIVILFAFALVLMGLVSSTPSQIWVDGVTCVNDSQCTPQQSCVNNLCANQTNELQCKTLYYYDSTSTECSQTQFCGAYMYSGLHTFENSTSCQESFNNKTECINDSDCPTIYCIRAPCPENICIDKRCVIQIENKSSCQTLYWYDDEDKSCEQKEFCDLYMYQGLKTFENQGDCLKDLTPAQTGFWVKISNWFRNLFR